MLGRRGRHHERVSAASAARLRDAPRRHRSRDSWSSYGNGIRVNDNTASVFDYLDPQWQWVMNAGWNKGVHNVKFGVDVHRLHMNHYEITAPSFNFTGRRHGAQRAGASAPNLFNGYADFLLGLPISAQYRAPESAARRGQRQQRAVGDASDVGVRHLHPRSVPADAQADGVGRSALGVLPGAAACRSRRRALRLHAATGCCSAASATSRSIAASRCRRISSRRASASRIARPTRSSSAPATRAIRRTTT